MGIPQAGCFQRHSNRVNGQTIPVIKRNLHMVLLNIFLNFYETWVTGTQVIVIETMFLIFTFQGHCGKKVKQCLLSNSSFKVINIVLKLQKDWVTEAKVIDKTRRFSLSMSKWHGQTMLKFVEDCLL